MFFKAREDDFPVSRRATDLLTCRSSVKLKRKRDLCSTTVQSLPNNCYLIYAEPLLLIGLTIREKGSVALRTLSDMNYSEY